MLKMISTKTFRIILGFLLVSGIFLGGFFVLRALFSSLNTKRHSHETLIVENIGLPIIEANILNKKDINGNDIYFLGKDGVELLGNRIINELGYGPEIFMLENIIIGDTNMIHDTENGYYAGSTNQIVINTNHFMDLFPVEGNDYIYEKVDFIFQVLFHEYGHHLAYSYLNAIPTGSAYASKEIYGHNGIDRVLENWNDDFIQRFKSYLNYELDTPKYSDADISDEGGPIETAKSIGSIYNQKDLFELSNGKDDPQYDALHDGNNYFFASLDPEFNINLDNSINENFLEYLYTMSELFARKNMQLNYGYQPTGNLNSDGWFQIPNEIYFVSTLLLQDTMHYQRNFNHGNLDDRFMYDGLFNQDDWGFGDNNNPANLYELFVEKMGQKDGSDVSFIWRNNTSRLTSSTSIHNGNPDEKNQIKIGGYVDTTEYNYLYFYDSEGPVVNSISLHNFEYKRKQQLNSRTKEPLLSGSSPYFYVLNEWVDIDDIENKPLFFAKSLTADGTPIESIPLTSVREDENGFASTYLSGYPYFLGDIHRATWNGVDVRIAKGSI